MSDKPGDASRSILGFVLILIATVAVVAWRAIVLLLFREGPQDTSLLIQALLAIVGVTFLACGLLVFVRVPGIASVLFVGFCICSGLHWGGPVELAAGPLRAGLILSYMLVSGILAATLLLRLALEFPVRSSIASRGHLASLLYVPVGLAAVLMAISLASPSESGIRTAAQHGFLVLHTLVTNSFSILALALVARHAAGSGSSPLHKRCSGLMVGGMLVAWLPYLVASAVGVGNTDVWNLPVLVLPVSFTVAFFGISTASASRPLVPILLLLLWATAQAPTAATSIEGEGLVLPSETCRGLFIVPVSFGEGQGNTLDLLLDTGSSWTLLDPSALQRMAGGEARAGKVTLRGGRIGRHELGPVRAYALPMRQLGLALGHELDGILGFPVFRNLLLTLDYPAEEIRISSGSLPRPDGREVFRAPGKRPHVDVTIAGRRIKTLVDSGYTGRFQLKTSDRLTWSVEPRPATTAVSAHGVSVKRGGRLDGTARVGPLDFNRPVVILGGGERMVGWHVLRHFVLTFDQRHKRMRMQADRTGPVGMAALLGTGMAEDPRPEGMRVVRVFAGTSAEVAGLREGDLVVAIDGTPVHVRRCQDSRNDAPGQRHVISYIRNGIRAQTEVETQPLIP